LDVCGNIDSVDYGRALTLLGVSIGACRAEDQVGLPREASGFNAAFQWSYSCPSSKGCAFTCPGTGGASHTTKLTIYLGKLRISDDENAFAIFYEFSTVEFPRGNGFAINTGLNALSCQVNGMNLAYSGPPDDKDRDKEKNKEKDRDKDKDSRS
jgi:hypothetical protein